VCSYAQIALLNEGVELRRTSKWTWNMVAELVGGGVSAVQCRKKGENLNKTFLQKQAEWDSEEVSFQIRLLFTQVQITLERFQLLV